MLFHVDLLMLDALVDFANTVKRLVFVIDISSMNAHLKSLLLFWPECKMRQMVLALSAFNKSL